MTSCLTTKIDGIPWVRHGFFGRKGGASGGIYTSLNAAYGSNDDRAHVAENRQRIANTLEVSPDQIVTPYQHHSADVITTTAAWQPGDAPKTDAIVTAEPGLAIGVLTADCAPVLFAAKSVRIVGVAHAGWRGALGGVLENTITAMKDLGARPDDISAAIGPCIRAASYEVSDNFMEPFVADNPQNARFFAPGARAGHRMFDLAGYITARLETAGIGIIHDTARDTLSEEEDYFSYRRTTQRQEKDYGRQLSAIMIKKEG